VFLAEEGQERPVSPFEKREKKMNDNVKRRSEIVRQLVADNYEEGRQDRCKRWVYRHIVRKSYPMSERTFWRYLRENNDSKQVDPRQMLIDFGDDD